MFPKSDPGFSTLNNDRRVWWRPGRIYIPAWQFSGLDYEITTATDIKSMGTGAANDTAIVESTTSGVTGLSMGANANSVEHLLPLLGDLDLQYNIYFRVWWTSATASATFTPAVLYKTYVPNSTALASPAATALDRIITISTMPAVAHTLMVTVEGVLKGGTIAESVEALQLGVSRTAATVGTPIFLGLEMRYTPRRLYYGDGMAHEAKAPNFIAGKTY